MENWLICLLIGIALITLPSLLDRIGIMHIVETWAYVGDAMYVFILIGLAYAIASAVMFVTTSLPDRSPLSKPTERDVLDGKAIYIETQHITGGDTIRTYHIEWKE